VLALHNFSAEPCRLEVPLEDIGDLAGCDDLLGPDRIDLDDAVLSLTLDGYGHRWFRVRRHGVRPAP
jgi:hypothetical protein